MVRLPKIKEVLLDENIEEQEFVEVISTFYKGECFIYTIIPVWEKELLNELSNQFIKVKDITLPRTFPRTMGYLGYVRDTKKTFIYEFYLRCTTIDFVFSTADVTNDLYKADKKNVYLYKFFDTNEIPHITTGPDGQWINIVDYNKCT